MASNVALKERPSKDEEAAAELVRNLADPMWRIRNLYYILDKNGKEVLFQPNEVQEQFIEEIWFRNVVPKARQRGFSTVTQIMALDACLFVANTHAAVIAQDDDTAKSIMDSKIHFAYDRLPDIVKAMVPLTVDNVKELEWANGSSIVVSTSVRGRTLQFLHISEYGLICARRPDRAAEIKAGSIPAVAEDGIVVIESTAEGVEGDFYAKVMQAKAVEEAGKKLTRMDYRLHFASWWDAEEYEIEAEGVIVTPKDHEYFDRIETLIGRPIAPRKRAWYVKKRDGDFSGDSETMKAQYPSTLDEAFEVSTEGVYLAQQLTLARKQGRIGKVPWRPDLPVFTWWDIGIDDDVAIWFHQLVGNNDHFIDFMEGSGEPPSYYARLIAQKPYVYGGHYLPHDGAKRHAQTDGLKTYEDMLRELGLRDIDIVPRTSDLVQAIQILRMGFSTYWFDEENCKQGLVHLNGYRKKWNERQAVWSAQPAHNGHQHAADAIRQRAQIGSGVRSPGASSRPKRRNRSGMAV